MKVTSALEGLRYRTHHGKYLWGDHVCDLISESICSGTHTFYDHFPMLGSLVLGFICHIRQVDPRYSLQCKVC